MPRPYGFADHAAFSDVTAAASAVLERLRIEIGFRFWAVTRLTGGTYAVVTIGDSGFPAVPGEQLPWIDTLCHRVLEGRAPPIAPDVREVPVYGETPLVRRWRVAAYLSVPLSLDGSSLFGTLCALDREPQPPEVTSRLPLVDLQARLLSTILTSQLRVDEARRRAERAEADATLDPLTRLVNRRGWELLLEREEQRCRRYGAVASVLAVDLDGLKAVNDQYGHAAGDALLRRAGQVLGAAVRSTDVVARLGGDEFAVLTVETDSAAGLTKRDHLQRLLARAGVQASIGVATREPADGLPGAWLRADRDMYEAKNAKHRSGR